MTRLHLVEDNMDDDLEHHRCNPDESWWEHDAQGIPLCRVCDECMSTKLAMYRPEILRGYGQDDVDEPIEPEPVVGAEPSGW